MVRVLVFLITDHYCVFLKDMILRNQKNLSHIFEDKFLMSYS